jgi:hypothetical protein
VPATSSVAAATATATAADATGVADDNDDAAVHKVPPTNWRRVQGIFCVCLLPCVMFITYPTLNGETGLHYRQADAISSQVQRYCIIVADREREKF